MTGFDEIPNKVSGGEANDLWPEQGAAFALNRFYRLFDGAEGWLGDSYFTMWSRHEIKDFRAPNLEAYPEDYWFFGSDGGGTQFGFVATEDGVQFCSAPDIGGQDDARLFEDWKTFVSSIKSGDYI